ncbi:MAG TPA: sensor histidine kinase [Bacteroidota bacterium]|nr:sensor histidine kinase [Bacteroidota bacterium]
MSSETNIILFAVISITVVVIGMFTFFVMMMIRSHRKIEAEQRERIRQMQVFSEKLQAAREEEQKRLSRELHDELGGTLTSLKYDLFWIQQHIQPSDELNQRMSSMQELIGSATKVVQRISAELRPKILDSLGLVPALEWLIQDFQKRTGINATFTHPESIPSLDDNAKTGIYRIVQEALTNVARHSQASEVSITLVIQNSSLHIQVTDNGKGFDESLLEHPDSLGLLSMQERARIIGATISIHGKLGKGTNVSVIVPVNQDQQKQS